MSKILTDWNVEDKEFWEKKGHKIATRNLWISIPALFLAFIIWQLWSILAVQLPLVGFTFNVNQMFWLTALPALSGATLRIFYSFAIPIFGGRKWTTISTLLLLIPAIGLGFAVQDPTTSYSTMVILSILCGLGGANFSSSMANISFFFPKSQKGYALGLNGGLGNLGVSAVQFITPIVVASYLLGFFSGNPQTIEVNGATTNIWLQNAGFIWVPFIILSSLAAWFGMNDIAAAKSSLKEQFSIFKRKHSWMLCLLYIGAFGSFIGFSAGFPLLVSREFPQSNLLYFAFLGPLVGALARILGGWLSDQILPSKITQYSFLSMILAVIGVIFALSANNYIVFFSCFLILFLASGISSGSVFAQAPKVFSTIHQRLCLADKNRINKSTTESAAVIGIMGALGAYGGFFIPKSFGTSISLTGNVLYALYGFIIFYSICFVVNWWLYSRKNAEVPC